MLGQNNNLKNTDIVKHFVQGGFKKRTIYDIRLVQKSLPNFKKILNPPSATVYAWFSHIHMIALVPYYKMALINLRTYSNWTYV